jgi:hypothetical protein
MRQPMWVAAHAPSTDPGAMRFTRSGGNLLRVCAHEQLGSQPSWSADAGRPTDLCQRMIEATSCACPCPTLSYLVPGLPSLLWSHGRASAGACLASPPRPTPGYPWFRIALLMLTSSLLSVSVRLSAARSRLLRSRVRVAASLSGLFRRCQRRVRGWLAGLVVSLT